MALIPGKQIDTGARGVNTSNIVDGALSADASGRAKFATDFFDSATVTAKFASASIALDRLAEAVLQADGGQALTGNLDANSNKVTNLADGTASGDAVNKGQLDSAIAGLSWKDAVIAASTVDDLGAGGAVAYANGTAGVGATLTGPQEVFPNQDGITLTVGDRLLVKDQSLGEENGIYELTTQGVVATTAWVLTRVTDCDESAELDSAAVFVQQGATHGDEGWTQTASTPTVGTTSLVWSQFTGAGSVSFGTNVQTVSATTANGGGSGTDAARDNHTHALTTGTPSTTIQSDAGTAATGTAASVLRTDAQLLAATAAPTGLAAANTQGSSTSLSRADHQHARDTVTQEDVTTENITGTDTALSDTLNNTPIAGTRVRLFLNGMLQQQGAGNDYTISGSTITWLASTGTAVDMDTSDELIAVYDY